MPFLALHVVLSFLLDLAHALTRSRHQALLRQQVRLYERQATRPRPSRWEKAALASVATKLPDLARVCLRLSPDWVAHPPEGPRRARAACATCLLAWRRTIALTVSCDTPYAAAKARRLSCSARSAIFGQRAGSRCGRCCAGRRIPTGLSTGK